MTPHVQRWLTAAVAVPALFAIVAFGPAGVFAVLILCAAAIGLGEYHGMVLPGKGAVPKAVSYAATVFMVGAAYWGDHALLLSVLSFSLLALFMMYLLSIRSEHYDFLPVSLAFFGIAYVPLLLSHLVLLRRLPDGVLWIFLVLVVAFSGDVAAFYVGRTFGRGKLLPLVSPGKSVAGTIGLMAGSTLGCVLYRWIFFPELAVGHAVVLGLVGGTVGQLGDLCESVIKRASGVKDSGGILPGHGGILDRLDCLLFLSPFVYYYRWFVVR